MFGSKVTHIRVKRAPLGCIARRKNFHGSAEIPSFSETEKKNVIGMEESEMKALVGELGLEGYRADQIWVWLYNKGLHFGFWSFLWV